MKEREADFVASIRAALSRAKDAGAVALLSASRLLLLVIAHSGCFCERWRPAQRAKRGVLWGR